MAISISPANLKSNDACWCGSGRKYKRCHKASHAPLRPGRLSPTRTVPGGIVRPDYAATGQPGSTSEPLVRSPYVIRRMRVACRAAAEVLAAVGARVGPGITTDELDALAHDECIVRGGYPSPLNYRSFPKSLCTSVNEVICHGIPDDRALVDGDIVNLDVTIYLDGVHGDTNATFLVGDVDEESRRLVEITREAMMRGIEAVQPGRPVSAI
ncbi:MAG: M24 family metallopeptidase, partial [Actinomycetota bacterium]|nr:M24 family metallopeptidase [Actinomycetota bacterium]